MNQRAFSRQCKSVSGSFLFGVGALLIAVALGGCGCPGDCYSDRVDFYTTTTDFYAYSELDAELEITLEWEADEPYYFVSQADLDLEVRTPSGEWVSFGDVFGDCWHYGDDFGDYGYGAETVVCEYAEYGDYEVRVTNRSNGWVDAWISASLWEWFGWEEYVTAYFVDLYLGPGEVHIVPIGVY